jgi:pimeloyl-ACP methyl ester carboxylesterase
MQEYYLLPMRRFAALLLLACSAFAAPAQDYAREARWRAEVVPNLVVGEAVDIRAPSGRAFLGIHTPGKAGKAALVLVHGLGVHPDHGVIGVLRMALADMGFTTLSIQMPVLAADARAEDYHPALFPEAAMRIAAAADWLAGRGHKKMVLASHSIGAWMSQYYLESSKPSPFAAWISMGRGGALGKLALPVLDVYGEKDNPAVLESAVARRAALERMPGSKQRIIAGADHFYTGRENELAQAVREFIEAL